MFLFIYMHYCKLDTLVIRSDHAYVLGIASGVNKGNEMLTTPLLTVYARDRFCGSPSIVITLIEVT